MESPWTDARACADDTASGEQSMTLAQKKKITRAAFKNVITALDALLPATNTTSPSQRGCLGSRSCGSRSMGRTGRSLIAILQDATASVKLKKAQIESQTQAYLEMRQERTKAMKSGRGFTLFFFFSFFFFGHLFSTQHTAHNY